MTITPEEIIQLRNLCDPVTGPPWLPRLLSAYETEKARADRLAKALEEIEAFAQDEVRMHAWDSWHKYIANGGRGSWPRDVYESFLDFFAETARDALAEEPKT